MDTVGLRELRQDASALLRRVEDGEELTVTVSGRPAARIVPATPDAWRTWNQVADLFAGPGDDTWRSDRDLLDHDLRDPWERS